MKINVLPQSIANMIAAGEVVERPASVVKELVENSVDAGAKTVTVEIQKGGMTYIRVTDDGCGIAPDEAETAFLRHATSKIQTKEDLNSIYTLGFRGEALASIAAVARVDMFTKTKDNTFGRSLSVEGGTVLENEEAGCGDGTTIIVRDLFFNTPARMKFLKNDATETGYVTDTVNKLILSHPEVKIRLIVNGRQSVASSGDGKLLSAIYSVYGKDYPRHMNEVEYAQDGIEVAGFVGDSSLSRKDRRQQVFFINGRYITSKIIASALSEAFQNTVMVGKHPVAVLMIKVNGNFVDVNVHPTKMEVRFSDDKKVYHSIYWAVKNALSSKKYVPSVDTGKSGTFDADILKIRSEASKVKNEATQLDINLLRDSFFAPKSTEESKGTDEVQAIGRSESAKSKEDAQKIDCADIKKETPEQKETKSQTSLGNDLPKTDPERVLPNDEQISDHIKNNAFFSGEFANNLRSPTEKHGYNNPIQKSETTEKTTALKQEKPLNDSEGSKKSENPSEEPGLQPAPQYPKLKCGVDFKLIGQVFATYIIVQKENEMIIIDQHAAHERIYFEQLLDEYRQKTISSQRLLLPVTVSFEASQFPTVYENIDFFESLGFECEEFGENTLVVRAYPASIGDADIADTLLSVAELIDGNCVDIKKTLIEEALHTMACKRAIKGNRVLEKNEMEALAEKVLSFEAINTCPHGRPICVSMTKYEMEKQFKRIV
ncbi:MAG: DNA mismatch repair endonuclease MutL [Clostridia bacterium]|nr:DNA mismatch repair endonuclease MutL [Clostridia bacterium]